MKGEEIAFNEFEEPAQWMKDTPDANAMQAVQAVATKQRKSVTCDMPDDFHFVDGQLENLHFLSAFTGFFCVTKLQ